MTHDDYMSRLANLSDSPADTRAVLEHVSDCSVCARDQRFVDGWIGAARLSAAGLARTGCSLGGGSGHGCVAGPRAAPLGHVRSGGRFRSEISRCRQRLWSGRLHAGGNGHGEDPCAGIEEAAMTRFWAVALFAAAAYAGADSTAAFDPQEKISLDLKDAKLTEVIATLGAMANLPVVIAPGLEASVSLRVKEMKFESVLELLSMHYGVSVRIENGRLVASAHEAGPLDCAECSGAV